MPFIWHHGYTVDAHPTFAQGCNRWRITWILRKMLRNEYSIRNTLLAFSHTTELSPSTCNQSRFAIFPPRTSFPILMCSSKVSSHWPTRTKIHQYTQRRYRRSHKHTDSELWLDHSYLDVQLHVTHTIRRNKDIPFCCHRSTLIHLHV